MNFELTDKQKSLKNSFEKFCKNEIAPGAELLDQAPDNEVVDFIKENIKKMADAGFLGLLHEEEYGGTGSDFVGLAIAAEEVAGACASTFLSSYASSLLFGLPLKLFGSKEQKEKYLPGIIKGEFIGCFGLTEPEAGSDTAGIVATAEKKGEKWILNGTKTLITNAPIADVSLVFAYSDREAGPDSGVTAFIVDRDSPGFSTGKPFDKLGYRGSPTGEIFLDGCQVSEDAVLGKAGEGYNQAMQTLEYGRIGMASASIGIAVACMDEANRYAGERKAFGRYINRFQEVSFRLAEMMILTDLSRLMLYEAAWALDTDHPEAKVFASCAKLFASEAATQVSGWALQVHGGSGYIKGMPVERLYRDAKFGDIGDASSEMQRIFIAGTILDRFKD